MFEQLPAFVPKAILIAVLGLLATAGLTYAAEQKLASTPATPAGHAAPLQKRAELIVPDLRRQAFVFAKGQLQDSGFAWRVVGGVHGYAANVVVGQSPAAGTRLFDTGAPLVTLTLSRNVKYRQTGAPEDISPYRATVVEPASANGITPVAPATTAPSTTTTTPATARKAPASTAPAATTPAPAATTPAPAAPAKSAAPASRYPQNRPAAFAAAGAPKEPLKEMPLVDRATLLGKWIDTHPKPTNANVKHWLYQNAWVVTGAKFGWWRGAEALKILIAVDRRTESLWGIGSRSRADAARALAEVQAKSR